MTKKEICVRACMYAINELVRKGSTAFMASAHGGGQMISWDEVTEWLMEEYGEARNKTMGIMKDTIGPAALLEQLAEESAELAHAALKLARIMRGENPTPVEYHDAVRHLIEEYTDVIQCGEDLEIEPDRDQIFHKMLRFAERYKAAKVEKLKRLLEAEE